jgi:aspartate racemase
VRIIGMLGGMSWESSALYYRIVNEEARRRLGGTASAPSILWTVDFAEVERLQVAGAWDAAGALLADAARRVEAAGAEVLVLCTNTMHKVAPAIEAAIGIPLLHIADVTAAAIAADGRRTVGLLATRYTMEQDFYRDHLRERFGIDVLVPGPADREELHRIIFDELALGIFTDASRARCGRMVDELLARGAEGVVLGCTEVELLVPADRDDRLYPSARLHAVAAVDAAMAPPVTPPDRPRERAT